MRGDHVHRLGLFQTASGHQALQPDGPRSIHEHDRVEFIDEAPLEEKRDHANYDRITTLLGAGDLAILHPRDARVDDSVQRVELTLIGEHDPTKRVPVEASILLDDVFAPALHDVPERLSLWAHGFTRELVRIDNGGAAIGQHLRYL